MPYIGSINPYDGVEPLDAYLERLDEFFTANDIGVAARLPADASDAARAAAAQVANRKKVASLLTLLGKQTYGVLQDLCQPDLPKAKTFEELIQLLKNHYKPKRLEVAESFKFNRCVQKENETVTEYATRLRGMASFCNYGAYLTRALRDQFVSGVRSQDIQKKLLEEG